jgi:hypothetical protein
VLSEQPPPGDTERLRWPRAARPGDQPSPRPLYVYLLDVDDDLADRFDPRMRLAARQLATARMLTAAVGRCDLRPLFHRATGGHGLLILDGVFAAETTVGDRTATELLGPGDLLQPRSDWPDELLERTESWRVLAPTRLALLDAEFAERVRPWPQIPQELLRRSGKRVADVDVLRAITSQPRLEVRLVLLLWHLAARWGRVEPSGVRVTLPLTHRLLGQLVAAERPSISHALARLANADLVTGQACDLHLHGTIDDHLEALADRAATGREHSVGADGEAHTNSGNGTDARRLHARRGTEEE